MVSQSDIQLFVNEIVAGYQPEKIYLFGSYANGTPNADSDIDLFIVKNTTERKKDRTEQVLNIIKSYPDTGIDMIIYTPEELENVKSDFVNIANEAIKTGKLLYERI
jgi:predicted nucleotidyltransferase